MRQENASRAALVALRIGLGGACGHGPGETKIHVQSELLPWVDVFRYHTYARWTALEQRWGACSQSEVLLEHFSTAAR